MYVVTLNFVVSIMQILCKRAQIEFTLILPTAAKNSANIASNYD